MINQEYRQLINEGLEGLPDEMLAEIADFVLFVRKRAIQPREFEDEIQGILLRMELVQLSQHEQEHLEQEFEDYDKRYPRE